MRTLVGLLTITVALTGTAAAQDRQVIKTAVPPGLPFSAAVRVGNMLYLSGQIGVLPGTTQLVDTGAAAQIRQTLENIKQVLTAAGSSMDRVVRCMVFLADMRDYATMNEIYRSYFPGDPPARSTVAVSGLAFGARAEIECTATTG